MSSINLLSSMVNTRTLCDKLKEALIKFIRVVALARGAADGIKPGVKRSETPGASVETERVRGAADSRIIMIGVSK